MDDLSWALGVLVATGGVLWGASALPELWGIRKETARKLGHIGANLTCAFGVHLVDSRAWVVGLALAAAPLIAIAIETRLLPGILVGRRERDYGVVASAVALAALSFFFWDRKVVITGALTILALADAAAGLVGGRWSPARHASDARFCGATRPGGWCRSDRHARCRGLSGHCRGCIVGRRVLLRLAAQQRTG